MPRGQGGTLSGFTPLSTPNAPTGLSVSAGFGSATVSFTPPADTGDAAVTSYIVTAIDESSNESSGVVESSSPITVPLSSGTFKFRAQAVNGFGPGQLTEFETGVNIQYSGVALYAWGRNSTGQLGVGGTASRSSPVQVGALINWSQVSAGSSQNSHTAAVKTDGTLWTWGSGEFGKLGHNSTAQRNTPLQVGALTDWAQVAAGYRHTVAVTQNGELYAWGDNSPHGALGDDTVIDRLSPVQIGTLTNWSQVSAGNVFSLAIKTDGTLWGWGQNNEGRVGDGTTVSRSSPVQIGALTNWTQVSAGLSFGTAVNTNGQLYAWGANTFGALGQGNKTTRSTPFQVGALTNWSQVSGGFSFTVSVKTDGTLWAWGLNNTSQLGDGTTVSKSSPIQVGGLTDWSQASAGQNSACVKTDGTLWTWGSNDDGKLGDGTTVSKSSPIQIGASTDWFSVTVGNDHTLAIEGVV